MGHITWLWPTECKKFNKGLCERFSFMIKGVAIRRAEYFFILAAILLPVFEFGNDTWRSGQSAGGNGEKE